MRLIEGFSVCAVENKDEDINLTLKISNRSAKNILNRHHEIETDLSNLNGMICSLTEKTENLDELQLVLLNSVSSSYTLMSKDLHVMADVYRELNLFLRNNPTQVV
jgi:hypothetical protein